VADDITIGPVAQRERLYAVPLTALARLIGIVIEGHG
jgi:hypothetical protein